MVVFGGLYWCMWWLEGAAFVYVMRQKLGGTWWDAKSKTLNHNSKFDFQIWSCGQLYYNHHGKLPATATSQSEHLDLFSLPTWGN
jgi:hypothetical protein